MRADANQIAFDVVERILDAAEPLTLDVAGTRVAVGISRDTAPPWPDGGFPGVAPRESLPAPVRASCTWPGGQVTLIVDCLRSRASGYRGDACLRVSSSTRWLLVSNVKVAVEDSGDGDLAPVVAMISRVKRKSDAVDQRELNRALQKLVSEAGLTMRSRSKAELAQIRLPEGSIEAGPAEAFRRALLVALLKLEFVDRAGAPARGTPVVDLSRLDLSPATLEGLADLEDDGEDDDDDDDDDDDSGLPRLRRRVARMIPDESERQAALELLAHAVENAHDEKPGGWNMHYRGAGLCLCAGRLLACRLSRGSIELSVMGPISADTRAALGAEVRDNEAWKAIPGGLLLGFPAAKAAVALDLLKDPFDRFVDEAMARMRRRIDPDTHTPELVAYLAEAVGRPLPQPELSEVDEVDVDDDDGDPDEVVASREPAVRGRAPIFEHSQRSIVSLIGDIEQGVIALPDLQRPFVWEDTKVRDLLDSLFVGFPVGTVVLWHTGEARDARAVGRGAAAHRASALVIDGQQRLTSLYAVIKGAEVIDKDGCRRQIKIAFRPRDGRFEVPDAAIRRDPEFLPDVSELWSGKFTKGQIRRDLLAGLRARERAVDGAYEEAVEENLDRVQAIGDFRFPVVDIRKTAQNEEASEEDVAEIFVRINNQGMRLGQADFVLTLLSVFHGPLRDRFERRAVEISEDSVIAVDTQQLLRATCAVGFSRAKMKAIYRFLRGVDPATGDTSVAERDQRLKELDRAADACMASTTWRDYDLRVRHAGFISAALVASTNAIVNAFAFYVRGGQAGLDKPRLDRLISRWLFGTLLTARYSGSSETVFEQDLARIRALGPADGDAFERVLDGALSETITGDYWSRTLVSELRTQRGRAPAALAFRAAQVVLGAKALFSDQLLQSFLSSGPSASRAASEQHHLFPKAWLGKQGISDRREVNQVANLADVGWNDNGFIGASGPSSYVPRLRERLELDDSRWGRMCSEHALPPGWENMPYDVFLQERRERMADIIRAAYRKLGGEAEATPIAPPWFLPGAELVWNRIVETERALRALVREVYARRFETGAAAKIEAAIPEREREGLTRALRSRPAGSDPMSVVDYLYLAQLPPLLFSSDVWAEAKARLGNSADSRQRLNDAIRDIAPVRNEIAHVREVAPERLQKANVACGDILAMIARS